MISCMQLFEGTLPSLRVCRLLVTFLTAVPQCLALVNRAAVGHHLCSRMVVCRLSQAPGLVPIIDTKSYEGHLTVATVGWADW